jgi:DNA-binding SARP family transcriptional activator
VDRRSEPETLILAATAERLRRGDTANVAALLEQARDAARATGNAPVEVAALTQLGHLAWWNDDVTGALDVLARLDALAAEGCDDAFPPAAFGRAMLAEVLGDHNGMLREAEAIDRSALSERTVAAADWLRARALIQLGRAEEAIPYAARAYEHGEFHAARTSYAIALYQSGRIDEALAFGEQLVPHELPSARDRLLVGIVLAAGLARLGRVEEAQRAFAVAEAEAPSVTGPRAPAYLALTRASLALADGDEELARAMVATIRADASIDLADPRVLFAALPFLALVYVLAPETRPDWHALDVGPDHGRSLDAVEALVAAREGGSVIRTAVAPERVVVALGIPWALELAAMTDDLALADTCVAVSPDAARRALRGLGGTEQLDAAVTSLRKRVRLPPAEPIRVQVLGPPRLLRDGATVDDPDWRRERVRSLLQLLVARRRATRAEVADALWPDLDAEAAAGNLRVTLRYLQRVLEPEREAGDAPWFVRSEGDVLALAEHGLAVDAWELEAGLDAAERAETAGRVGEALQLLEGALAQWQGEYLTGVYDDWAGVERDRLRARFVQGSIRAAELLSARGEVERAVAVAVRGLEAEPWSERTYQVLAEAHLARGDRAAARRVIDRCRAALGDLGVEPSPATVALDARVSAG